MLSNNPMAQAIEMERCRRDAVYFVREWGWTYDPRVTGEGGGPAPDWDTWDDEEIARQLESVSTDGIINDDAPAWMPFALWPRQEEMLRWFDKMVAFKVDGLVEKSRDSGFTWLAAAWAVHKWRFYPGFDIAFGSRKLELVDQLGDPKTIFSKIRSFISQLPVWMLPEGYDSRHHDNYLRILNPANGNSITGEGGKEMGRGGRVRAYFIDEAGFLEKAEDTDRATDATTNTRIWGSTVNGPGNLFYRKRHDGRLKPQQIFIFRAEDDPRKTPEWLAAKEAATEPHVFASEYMRDYTASIEGICIPGAWVQSAFEIYDLLRARGIVMEPGTFGIVGLDVGGGGKGKSVAVGRFGPLVMVPKSWGQPDTTETANKGLDYAEEARATRSDGTPCHIRLLNFDSPGIGAGVQSAIKKGRRGITTQGINTGVAPTDRRWPDGETSEEKFANLKAELWFVGRARFKATHEMKLWLQGKQGGKQHSVSDLISLPPLSHGLDVAALSSQLSVIKWNRNEKGKFAMETKIALATRGIASPDHADGLMLTMQESSAVANLLAAFGVRPRPPGSGQQNRRPGRR